MKVQKLISLLICITFVLSALISCEFGNKEPKTQVYYEFFDTVSTVYSYRGDSEDEFAENCNAVSELLLEYHRLLDIYYEYSGINNLKTVNLNAGKGPVAVDEKLIDFLLYAKEMYTLTEGKTNIAMGSVLKLWHDAREDGIENPESAKLPQPDSLSAAAEHTDIDKLIIDENAGTVFISDADMQLDVGSVGKGYATEKAAEMLISRGVTSYVLNIGGNIRAIGEKPSGDGWITGITNPDKSSNESFVTKVIIKDISLVTSGDYERYYTVDGVRYHHIIDPNTNMPAKYFASVSVFTDDSGMADALSTALFCMSYEDGLKLIKDIGKTDAIWVYSDGTVKMTEGITISG